MPERDGQPSAPAESGGESYLSALQADADAAFAALDGGPAPEPEAPAGGPAASDSVEPSADVAATAPDPVVADLDGPDDEPITRRNARELVEKARAQEREALERAQALEQQQQEQQARWQRLQEQSAQWNPPRETYEEIDRAVKRRDFDTLARHGLYSIDDAIDRLATMDDQREANTAMLGYWQQVFMGNAGETFRSLADRYGVGREYESIQDFRESMDKLIGSVAASRDAEWKGKYDALKAEYDALKARAGALATGPETEGRASATGSVPRTAQDVRAMNMQDFERNFDKILSSLPTS